MKGKIIIAGLVLLTTGCASDDVGQLDSPQAVAFMSGITHSMTRTTTRDNVWDGTEQIAVSDVSGSVVKPYRPEGAGTSVALTPYGDDASTKAANTIYWPINKGARTFEAWYPYNEGVRPSTWTVAADQSAITNSEYDAYDLLFATSGTVANGATVTLPFYHQMAHVIVYIRGLAWTAQEINSITFGDNNVAVTGTVAMGSTGIPSATGYWSVGAANNTVTLRHLANTLTWECLLPPQTGGSASGNLLTFDTTTDQATFNDKKQENEQWNTGMAAKTYNYNSAINLEAGKEYSFFIRLERVGMSVASTITDWDAEVSSAEVEAIYQPITMGGSLTGWEDPETKVDAGQLDFTHTEE